MIYNAIREQSLGYIGDTCWYDKITRKIFPNQAGGAILWIKFLVWGLGEGIILFRYTF